MKKIIFSVALLTVATCGFSQNSLVNKSQTKYEELQTEKDPVKVNQKLTEIEALLEPALTSAETKNPEMAWNMKAKLEDKRFQIELMKAANKQPFDTLAFYNHLNNCVAYYDKADQLERANPKFKEPSKIRPISKLNIVRYRPYFVNCGSLFSGNGENKMAYEAFDKWLKVPSLSIFSDDPEAFKKDTTFDASMIAYYACLSAYQAKDYEKALAHFDEATKYTKEQDQVYLLKAQVYKDQGDTVKWINFLRETALKFPEHVSFAQNVLAYYQMNNQMDKAMSFADELIAKDPTNKIAYNSKGVALFGQGKFLEAVEFFKKAAEIDASYTDAYLNAGLSYSNAAIEIGNKLPKSTSSPAYAKGVAKVKDLYQKAEPYFIHYRELKPEDSATWGPHLKSIYYITGQKDKLAEINSILKE
jgi:tetratricopeptide (TPR) repeat protein